MSNNVRTLCTETGVPCTMRDGAVLRADIYRPAGAGRWPVLLHRTPYGRAGTIVNPLTAVQHGFVLISQDVRGRGDSGGEWYPLVHEADDGFDAVEMGGGHVPCAA